MLRLLVVLLLAANALWFAWAQGGLPAGLLPFPREADQREPQRMSAQVHPERVRVLPPPEARRLADLACLQAGPFEAAGWTAATTALAAAGVPDAAWTRVDVDGGALLRVPEADGARQALLRGLSDPLLAGAFRPCP